MEEFCAEIGQTEPHAKTVDKKLKEIKKLKTVKFAVEAMETNDETIKNKLKDSRVATIKNELKDARTHTMDRIQKWSRVENGQAVEPEGIIELSDVVVVGTLQRE